MNNNDIQILDKQTIESMIYTIRGQKVMLGFDLARIYGYSTNRFNEQVKKIEKFLDGYRFQLKSDELSIILRSHFVTSSWGGQRYFPFVLTEQGIYILMIEKRRTI